MRSVRLLIPLAAFLVPACSSRSATRIDDARASNVAPAAGAESLAFREQAADQQVRHVLSRLAFGARPGDEQRVRAIGVDRWIEAQLRPEALEDGAVEEALGEFRTLRMSAAQLTRRYPPPQLIRARQQREGGVTTAADTQRYREAVRASQQIIAELAAARVMRATSSERQLEEVMVDFWHNHFSVFLGKGAPMRYFLVEYDRDVIRPRALGRFRDLLGAVAHSEAMLFYLDNWQSAADSGRRTRPRALVEPPRISGGRGRMRMPPPRPNMPADAGRRRRGLNENYARELLELHTLGVGGGYTQQDVIEVARAFTGWTIENPRRGGGFIFRSQIHDAEEKHILGTKLPAGRGIEDGEQVLDLLARHPSTARFIATKLARRFVSDAPPESVIDRAAETFQRTDGDIRAAVRAIVTSPEFFSVRAYRSKVKSPFELVVSTARALDAPMDPTPRTAMVIARLGQPLWGHQAPDGWPEVADPWINAGSILNRINFGMAAAAGVIPGSRRHRWPFTTELENADSTRQVDGIIRAILGGEASPDTRAILLRGENPLTATLAGADSAVRADSADADAEPADMGMGPRDRRGGVFARIGELDPFERLVGLALGSPEFQRR